MAGGVVEVVALLGSVKRGFCRSSAVWAIVNQVTAAVENKPGPATCPINAQRDVILSLNIDIAPMIEELKCSTCA